jgi:hypothetical protein
MSETANTSDATQNTAGAETTSQTGADTKETTMQTQAEQQETAKTFTQEEVDRIAAKARKEEKAKLEKHLSDADKSASMEPRSFKRGNLFVTSHGSRLRVCFNGATIFQS